MTPSSTFRVLPFVLTCLLFAVGAASVAPATPVAANVRQSLDAKLLSGMRITTLKLDANRANINGVSPSNALVSQFLRKLDSSANYKKVELVSIEQKDSMIHFYIIADVQCAAGGENLCDKTAVKSSSVFKCTQGGKTVFQDRPCAKS